MIKLIRYFLYLTFFICNNSFADKIITDYSIHSFSNSPLIHSTVIENNCLLLVNLQGDIFIWSTIENKLLSVYSERMLIDIVKYDSVDKSVFLIGDRLLSDSFEICKYQINKNVISHKKTTKTKEAISCLNINESGNVLIGNVLGDVFKLDKLNLNLTKIFNVKISTVLFIEHISNTQSFNVGYSDGKILHVESFGKKFHEIIDCSELYTFEIKKADNYYITYSKDYLNIYNSEFKLVYKCEALNTRVVYTFNNNFVVFKGKNRYYNLGFKYDSLTSKKNLHVSIERSFYKDSLDFNENQSVKEINFNLKVSEFDTKKQTEKYLVRLPGVTAITSQENELYVACNNSIYKYNSKGDLLFVKKLHEPENGVTFGTGQKSKYFNVYTNAKNSYNFNTKTGEWISSAKYTERNKIHIILPKKDVLITEGHNNSFVYEYIPNVIYGDQNYDFSAFKHVNINLKNNFFKSRIQDIVYNEVHNLMLILTSDSTLHLYDLNKGDIVFFKKFNCVVKQIKSINDSFMVLLETKMLYSLNGKSFVFSEMHNNVNIISNSIGNVFMFAQDTSLFQYNVLSNKQIHIENDRSVNQIQLIKSDNKIVFAILNSANVKLTSIAEDQNHYYTSISFNNKIYLTDSIGNLFVLKNN